MFTSTGFIKSIYSDGKIVAKDKLNESFNVIWHLFISSYAKYRRNCLTDAFSALELMLNAEVYFKELSPDKGEAFLKEQKGKFLKHFDYEAVVNDVKKGEYILALTKTSSNFRKKWNTQGVLGKFNYWDRYYYYCDPNENTDSKKEQQNKILVYLEIANRGVIAVPVCEIEFIGKWDTKLELIM